MQVFKTVMILFSMAIAFSAYASEQTPAGYWKTIDDKTKKVKSIVKIWEADGQLKGKIIKIFPEPGKDPDPKCLKCPGAFKNQRVIGIIFLWNFKGQGRFWKNGKVLDPNNGKIYSCELKVSKDGKKLDVFGYIRILIKIGRHQTWVRTTEAAAK